MSLWEKVKNIMSIPEEDEFDEELEETSEPAAPKKTETYDNDFSSKQSESLPRVHQGGRSRSNTYAVPQKSSVQVVLVKPERFDDVPAIADHLNARRTVVLNLENTPKEIVRRLIDFLSGVAYANKGQIKRAANSTFVITPENVDVSGDVFFDEHSGSGYYN